jgi:GT2 family glycosyltransferase
MTGSSVSLAICTCNRANALRRTLISIAELTLPPRTSVELVVIDNNSSDCTPRLVHDMARNMPMPVRHFRESRPGLAFARNRAISESIGAIIAWTDDDCLLPSDWLSRMLQLMCSDPTVDILGGRVELHCALDAPICIKSSPEREIYRGQSAPGAFLLGCNMAIRRRAFETLGGFDVRFGAGGALRAGEDAEFVLRAQRAGLKIVYEPAWVLYHDHGRRTVDDVEKIFYNYHFGDGGLLVKYVLQRDLQCVKWFYWTIIYTNKALLESLLTGRDTRRRYKNPLGFLQGSLTMAKFFINRTPDGISMDR